MSTVTERFSISPNIYSTSDEDGSTILDIKHDKIYNLIGAGSVMSGKTRRGQRRPHLRVT